MPRPLYVVQPLLPDLNEAQALFAQIWKTKVVTNGGPFHQQLEAELRKFLGVPTAMLCSSGTIALLIALRLFELPAKSEVIATPLTFAATAHAIQWNSLIPVFADINQETLTLDPASVEMAITKNTSAILAVHVYGTICDLDGLQSVATKYGIRLLYDAAHAFGSTVHGKPIGSFGDASIFSFHATKLFTTLEGGLITTNRHDDKQAIYYLRNFGIKNEEEVVSVGINGKMNEIQAAIGLLNINLVTNERNKRAKLRESYGAFLRNKRGLTLMPSQKGVLNSEQYFAVVIDESLFGRTRDDIYNGLKSKDIHARKYFHPICTDFVPYKDWPIHTTRTTPYVEFAKSRVLCLPFHSGVDEADLADICAEFTSK